ncbi:MAG: Ig-like domain-containing protein [Candidatus Nitrospinota bacterium M3_3B_026]
MERQGAAAVSALVLLLVLSVARCGGTLDQKKEGEAGHGDGLSLELSWPEGYSYDRAAGRLFLPSGQFQKSAPAYVTKVTLRISGDDMEPVVLDVPPDTLRASATLSYGVRRFDLVVETNIGVTFTGSTTLTLAPGVTAVLKISLEINAPPVIKRIDMSNPEPKKGDSITIAAVASDPDPDDVLIYKWEGTGPEGEKRTFEGKSFTGEPFEHGGTYRLTLTVSDGHGGVARKDFSFTIINELPVIVDISSVYDDGGAGGDPRILLSCSATDADDPPEDLGYFWFGPFGWRAEGKDAVYNGSCGQFTCEARDDDGGVASRTVEVQSSPPAITGVTQSKQYVKKGDTVDLSCSASDPDNDILEYEWQVGNYINTGSFWSYVFKAAGDVKPACVVTDWCGSTDKKPLCLNSCQSPRDAAACSNDFSNGVVKVDITVPMGADLDLEVTDPNGVKTWYGKLRPGNGSELCVDSVCSNTSQVELIFWKAGSAPVTGMGNYYTVKVTYANDCGAGSINYDINFTSNGDCSTTGYCFYSVTGPATNCNTVSSCGNTLSISSGLTDTFTFDITSP